jgi:predicted Zn-ribbon and HTH transcriptional regulator
LTIASKNDNISYGPDVEIKGNRCSRCGYEWVSRQKGEVPTVCPRCKSPYWKTKRRNKKI